jgi:hypothetical protein
MLRLTGALVLALFLGGCIVHTNGHRHSRSRCGPGYHWDGHKCKHNKHHGHAHGHHKKDKKDHRD